MAKYPAQLQSANLNEFGIVYADEVQGHKTVATLSALYAITDPILSKSVVNTGNDAIGQEWYVISEGCYYRLDNWANRRKASGWTKIQVVDTEFNSLSTHGADKIKNFTTSPSTVTLNYNTWRSSTVNEDGTAVINAATQSAAGVLTAADKTKLDGLNTDSINDISVTSNANKATITFVSDNGNKEDISTTIDFPISTTTAAGTMSAKDKTELDRINTANFALGAVTPAASTVGIAASKTNVTDGTTAANNITLPAATQSAAGVMTATDKQNLDVNIPNRITNLDNRVTTEVDRLEELIESSSSEITNDLNVEIQARKDGDNQLQTNINNLQSTMNTELAKKVGKVTVAGSGNAVTTASISGDTLTLTKGATYNNYVHPAGSAPSKASGFYKFSTDSTSHVASVTAVAKSDITALGIPGQDTTYGNATQSTSGLMSAADKTKLDGISTGANKYVHPTGEAANKTLGLYKVATDATSHVKQVAAVTKADITALGIPAQNTNTTYTFANGSAGNFTVTPSGGSAQTVSVGKPANAGNADTVGGISPSAFVKKAGDTMTGNLTVGNTNSYHCVLRTDGVFTIKATPTVGGWNRGYEFVNANDTVLAKFGAYGSGQNFVHCYIGTNYEGSDTWQRWNSSGSVITVPLTTAAITSSGFVKTTQEMIAKYLRFEKDGTNVGYIGAGSTANNDIYIQSQNDNSIHFCVSGYSTSAGMTVHTNSNVSIGGDAATEKLNVAGNITSTGKVSAANGFFKESDARLKSDIKPLDYTLDQICSIPTVSFIMNDQKQIGTIAQNLEELGFEDIVTESDTLKSEVKNPEQFESFTKDGEEYVKVKKVEYEMLGVLAIEGVKMLKDEIEKLKAEIETLKNKQHE